MMKVRVRRVSIGTMATVGVAYGEGPAGEVTFAGDHRPMRWLGEALARAEEPIEAMVEEWQILSGEYVDEFDPREPIQ